MGNEGKNTLEEALPLVTADAYTQNAQTSAPRCRGLKVLAVCALLGITVFLGHQSGGRFIRHCGQRLGGPRSNADICPQMDALQPEKYGELWASLSKEISTDDGYRTQAVDWLAGAVRVKTESFDTMGPVNEDPRWEVFGPFHDYLLSAFPQVHATLKLTKVNTYGLLYEWVGSDTSLKPLLLAAHQDVVPVDATTVDQWTYPPYSGHYDGDYIWGRGSSDDKSGLIGVLAGVETLLKNDFQPRRTVVLAFGFDEESSGYQGAGTLAPVIEDIYGKDGIAMVVDEGSGFSKQYGSWVASPGVAEKGYYNVKATVQTAGGHSSVPPAHTSIGIIAALLVKLEENPMKAELTRAQPVYWGMQCLAEHAKGVPNDLRRIIKRSAYSDWALKQLEEIVFEDHLLKSLVGSTQAIDMIHGGVKSNALPEQVWAIINHRVTVTSNVAAVQKRDTDLLVGLARRFNLTYSAFGSDILAEGDFAPARGSLVLEDASHVGLEPAPLTPVSGEEAAAYRLLSGTIRGAFEAYSRDSGDRKEEEKIIVAPSMMSGNTDTRFYWDLSRNIFRYNHHSGGKSQNALADGIHTVNEHIAVDTFLEMIQFFATLILNMDEAKTL